MAALEGLGFVVDWFDRGSYRREDPAEVARLRARDDARALLIARDMPVLRNTAKGLDPLLPMGEIEALGGAEVEALLGLRPDGAPIFAALLAMRRSNSAPTRATAFSTGGFWPSRAARTSSSSTCARSRSAASCRRTRRRCWPRPRRS